MTQNPHDTQPDPLNDPLHEANKLFDQLLYSALQSRPEYRTKGDLPALAIAHARAADQRLALRVTMLQNLRRWQTVALITSSLALLSVLGMTLQWLWADNAGSFTTTDTTSTSTTAATTSTTLSTSEYGMIALVILIAAIIISSLWKTLDLDPAI